MAFQTPARWRDRRRPLSLIGAIVAVLAIASACGGNTNATQPSTDSPRTTQAGSGGPQSGGQSGGQTTAPKGGTLVVDNVFNNDGLDPAHEASVTSNMIFHAVYDTLLTYEPGTMTPVPSVAKSYESSADAKVFTFHLRDDVTFADGSTLTSQDVAFSFNRLINVKSNPASRLAGVTVATPDAQTVVLTSADPNPALPSIVGTASLAIVQAKAVKEHGGSDQPGADKSDSAQSWLNTNSAGSGPYVVKSVNPKQEYVLARNPHYWGTPPTFDTIIVRNTAAPAQLLSVQRGENEIAYDIAATQVSTLEGNDKVQVVRGASTNIFFLTVNLDPAKSPVTANAKIREAIRYGLDYEALRRLGGKGAVQLPGLLPQGVLGALDPADSPQRDLDRAKAAVAASGIKNPTFKINYVANFSIFGVSVEQVAQVIQASLKDVGIDAVPNGKPLQEQIEITRAGKQESSANLWAEDYPDPSNIATYWVGGKSATNIGYTAAAYPEHAAILAEATKTADQAKRADLYQQLQRKMAEDSPYFPEFAPEAILVGTANLTGLTSSSLWGIDLSRVGLK